MFSSIFGLTQSLQHSSDHSIIVRYSSVDTIILAVSVDDIVVTGDDHKFS